MSSNKAIPQRKQLAMGMEPRCMARGGMVTPRKATSATPQKSVRLPGALSPLTRIKMATPPVESRKTGGRACSHEAGESAAFEKKEERR